MKTSFYRRTALAGLIAITMLSAGAVITPASAQIGGIVHDPRNYAQNILTAARTLEQINNQIKQLQNQATSLVNEARNLQSLPVSTLQELQGQVDRTRELLGQAQRVAFDDGEIKKTFDARFGKSSTPTRNGAYKVYWKSRDHDSSLYDSPMPFAMFFSGGQAVHYSSDFARRGYNGASHGCVNVRDRAAIARLFDLARVGDKVIVYN